MAAPNSCAHQSRRCLNQYDTFRKYECADCAGVFICACDEPLALQFRPYQTVRGTEYQTGGQYPVDGFAEALCAECRGEPEPPFPMAAVRGRKGKIERFYWREITKTFHTLARDWLTDNNESVEDVLEFGKRFPDVQGRLQKEARAYWQKRHRGDPKYDVSEPTQSELFSELEVPEVVVYAEYTKVSREGTKVGKWINSDGHAVSGEEVAAQHYESEGWTVLVCERTLITILYGTLCHSIVQDPDDPHIRIGYRHSTRGWTSRDRNTPLIAIPLPEDFGGPAHFERRGSEYSSLFAALEGRDLAEEFERSLGPSENLRDYLWVNDDAAIDLARATLRSIPQQHLLEWTRWVAGHFWNRQPGWPDLLLLGEQAFRFAEVKTPHDKLSQEQIAWFGWARGEANVPCEICRVRRSPPEETGTST